MPIVAQKFPSPVERQRIATLTKYGRLYEGEHMPVLGLHEIIKAQYKKEKDIVYLAHNLPAYVSDFYGDFVAGDTEKLIIRGNTGRSEIDDFVDEVVFENDLKEKIVDIATEQSEYGFAPILGWMDEDDIFHIDVVGQDQYFPQPDGSIVFATYRNISEDPTRKRLVVLTQEYRLRGDDCTIERKAWEADDMGVIQKPFDFATMAALVGRPDLLESEVLADIEDLPVRQIDNRRRTRWGFGKSDYVDIMPQLAEVNERATHIATQLLKNLGAKMQLPSSMFNEDGKVEYFEAIAIDSKDDPEAKYVINENPLIDAAQTHIDKQLKVISTITAVPLWELLKTAMPERVESLRMQLFSAVRRSNQKRAKIKRALNDMLRIGLKMRGIDFDEDLDIRFSDVLPIDELVQAETENVKVSGGLSSRRRAIMRLENVDEDEAEEELKQIREEEKLMGVNLGEPPQLGEDGE